MKLKQLKKVGIILRPSTPELKDMFRDAKALFEKYGIEVLIDNNSAGMIGILGQPFELLCESCDALVTIGGDGTLISVARRSYSYQIPVLGIHAGKLGFMADLHIAELEDFILRMQQDDYRIDQRSMLEAIIETKAGNTKVIAFNDIVLTRPSISKMIHLDVSIDDKAFNNYYGDGIIISTPTGSTAYNLSAGGPILFPLTKVFALTPICPHSLTQRPVVLPGHFQMKISTPDTAALAIIDGQDIYEFGEGECMRIKLADEYAHLIHKTEFDYFNVLKEKLNWGV